MRTVLFRFISLSALILKWILKQIDRTNGFFCRVSVTAVWNDKGMASIIFGSVLDF